MATAETNDFLAGVVEGFYGAPWTRSERFNLFAWLANWRFNSYLYAPKDDLKHRAIWRDAYLASEANSLAELIRACQQHKLRFIYALSPGLDIDYASDLEVERLRQRFSQLVGLGCTSFALLFDDIPDRLNAEGIRRWGSLASAQSQIANALFDWTQERSSNSTFLFCPTPYCGRMSQRQLGGNNYLATIGRELRPGIDILWTGPEIVSERISIDHIEEVRHWLRRQPVLWDNLHANDYDGRRFYCGPYAGRSTELRACLRGVLSNPNCEFPLNYVPLRTLARWLEERGQWDPRQAYLHAMEEWLPAFATVSQPVTLEDLVLLGDSYYLPHEEGREAEELYQSFRRLMETPPAQWAQEADAFRHRSTRLRECCARMADLVDRPLFHALSRRVWDLREELDLLERYVAGKQADPQAECCSDFHLPRTYRGGLVARLQRLLQPDAAGVFHPVTGSASEEEKLAEVAPGD